MTGTDHEPTNGPQPDGIHNGSGIAAAETSAQPAATRPDPYPGELTRPSATENGEPTLSAYDQLWRMYAAWVTAKPVAIAIAVVGLIGLITCAGLPGPSGDEQAADRLPPLSESARYAQIVADAGADADPTVLLVVTRTDDAPLTAADRNEVLGIIDRVETVDTGAGPADLPPPVLSDDRQAYLVSVPLPGDLAEAEIAPTVDAVTAAATNGLGDGLLAQATGGPAFSADIGRAFEGANFKLLLATVVVVVVLLLFTYRSPVLWILPVLVIALTDGAAAVLSKYFADALGLTVTGDVGGITSVLVFGAGANYALLMISRYREELSQDENAPRALARAVAGTTPAICASNITVVLALLALAFAQLPGSKTLGVVAGSMLLFTLVSVLLLLPALLRIVPRAVFWPFVPRPGSTHQVGNNSWAAIARRVTTRPLAVATVSIAALFVLGSGLWGASFGLTQTEQFRNTPASVLGAETLQEHFGTGAGAPIQVLVPTADADTVTIALQELDAVTAVTPGAPDVAGQWQQLLVITPTTPASDDAFDAVTDVRSIVTDGFVGGPDAEELDYRTAAWTDLRLIVPVILGVVFLVLVLLLRALVAPVMLLAMTSLSAVAALGMGVWVSLNVLDYPAIGVPVVLYAFLFLIALGVDYTIFLMDRAREECRTLPTRDGVVKAVGVTGGVITSAGVVLAAVFVVLGVLPLLVLAQLGAIVCLGILLDTFVVRTIVVPALCALLGDRVWWPGNPAGSDTRISS